MLAVSGTGDGAKNVGVARIGGTARVGNCKRSEVFIRQWNYQYNLGDTAMRNMTQSSRGDCTNHSSSR